MKKFKEKLLVFIFISNCLSLFAQNSIATASSSYEQSGWGTAFAIDGQTTEVAEAKGWSSNSNRTRNHEEWFQIDLRNSRTISGFQLYSRASSQGFPLDFRIEVSSNGNNWTTVVNKSNYSVQNSSNIFGINTTIARYVRIVGTKLRQNPLDNNSFRMQFTEVNVLNSDFENSISVTASSSYESSGWGLSFVNDGEKAEINSSKGWSSNSNKNNNHTEWLQFDMGISQNIKSIDLYSRLSDQGFPLDFKIQVSSNGNNWNTVLTRTDYQPSSLLNTFTFQTAEARYLRIEGTKLRQNPLDNNSFRMQFTEVDFVLDGEANDNENDNDFEYVLERINPVYTSNISNGYFLDFGKAAFASMEFEYTATSSHTLTFHLGEKLENNRLDKTPGGTIQYQRVEINVSPGTRTYQVALRPDTRNTTGNAILLPSYIPVLMPFRYVEVENIQGTLQANTFTQLAYFGPWNETASDFNSDDDTLNQIWDLCKYSIKATSFMGLYIDGERERIPYEGDAYINQLSHYGTDASYGMARNTIEYLMDNPTWPIEWHQHMPLMFYADYMYTGNTELIAKYYDEIVDKSLYELRRSDGLISENNATTSFLNKLNTTQFRALVDWPATERDGYVFKSYNTVINSFYYKDLVILSEIALALGKTSDAQLYTAEAELVKTTFNNVFFDEAAGVYTDGEGTSHASIHANLFPLAMGLVPEDRISTVVNFVKSKGMACSVYAAQYLMEGLYNAGEEEYALQLLTDKSKRSWYNMIAVGSTITMEAWDMQFKPNSDWNHAWGAVPANIIPNYLWGIKPKTPGFNVATIQPQLSSLKNTSVKMPTIHGSISASFEKTANNTDLYTITIPNGIKGEFSLPDTPTMKLIHNGLGKTNVQVLVLNSGTHTIEITDEIINTSSTCEIDLSVATPELIENQGDKIGRVNQNNFEFTIIGNGWNALNIPQDIQEDDILTFQFKSTEQGEEHAIGFTNSLRNVPNSKRIKVYGTQNVPNSVAHQSVTYNGSGNWQSFSISIGNLFKGSYSHIVFVNDNDARPDRANSSFRNIKIVNSNDNCGTNASTVQLQSVNFVENKFRIYPNPTMGEIFINMGDLWVNEEVSIMLSDMNGRVNFITNYTRSDNTIKLDLSSFEKGIYALTIKSLNSEVINELIILN